MSPVGGVGERSADARRPNLWVIGQRREHRRQRRCHAKRAEGASVVFILLERRRRPPEECEWAVSAVAAGLQLRRPAQGRRRKGGGGIRWSMERRRMVEPRRLGKGGLEEKKECLVGASRGSMRYRGGGSALPRFAFGERRLVVLRDAVEAAAAATGDGVWNDGQVKHPHRVVMPYHACRARLDARRLLSHLPR